MQSLPSRLLRPAARLIGRWNLDHLNLPQANGIRRVSAGSRQDEPWYVLGVDLSRKLQDLPLDIKTDHELDAFTKGIEDTLSNNIDRTQITSENATAIAEILSHRKEQRFKVYYSADAVAGQEEGASVYATGLVVKTLKAGKGQRPLHPKSFVTVYYSGRLPDGTLLPASGEDGKRQRATGRQDGDFATFRLTDTFPGWSEGVAAMQEGEVAKLTIPSKLAFGPEGAGPVPPHTPLVFFTELLSVENH